MLVRKKKKKGSGVGTLFLKTPEVVTKEVRNTGLGLGREEKGGEEGTERRAQSFIHCQFNKFMMTTATDY